MLIPNTFICAIYKGGVIIFIYIIDETIGKSGQCEKRGKVKGIKLFFEPGIKVIFLICSYVEIEAVS